MENPKILVTFGSDNSIYDESNKSWVNYLGEQIPFEKSFHFAIPNLGNDEIARKVLYEISNLLNNNVDSRDLLVGIMWESMDRIQEYSHDKIKSTVVNLEHYLRTQWLLEKFSIKYFMANSHPSAKISERNGIKDDFYVKFLQYGLDYAFWIHANSLYFECLNSNSTI